MTTETVNSLLRYFEALHSINRDAITLCGVDVDLIYFDYEKMILEIASNLTRIIPITYDKTNEKMILKETDGILSFKCELPELKGDFELLLTANYDFINDLRLIRNKYQHSVHLIKTPSLLTSNNSLFTLGIELGDERITFHLGSLLYLLKDLNHVMDKIVMRVHAYKVEKENAYHYSAYLDRLTFMHFEEYNTIFKLDIQTLISIGKLRINF